MAREIDVAGATSALEDAGINPMDVSAQRLDPFAVAPAAPAATEPAADPSPDPVAPEAPAVEKTTEELFAEFTEIPDEALTPADQQMRRSLQADYTKKSQEAAPWRKLAGELGVENPEDLRAVIDTARQLQDPNNWEQLHTELTAHLQSTGRLTQAQAQVQAADQMAAFAPADPADPSEDEYTDPAVAALMKQVSELTQQVNNDRQARAQSEAQAQQQRDFEAMATQLTAAEERIKAANPHYRDSTIGAIYKFLGPDMDLEKARLEYESVVGAEVAHYLSQKGGTAHAVPTPVPGAGVISEPVRDAAMTREEGHAAAMAWAAAADQAE